MRRLLTLTFAAVLPHAQVDLRDVVTADVAVRQLGHPEHVALDARDVVAVIAQHPGEGRLLQLGQLGGREHAGVLVPEPEHAGRRERGFICCGHVTLGDSSVLKG